ncbi:MAG: lamin tail domain-containing protein [Deltaproteobacteria bacterium]|nr:lamin tail domain-containing protein [Deltaproteobacteria bacterium]
MTAPGGQPSPLPRTVEVLGIALAAALVVLPSGCTERFGEEGTGTVAALLTGTGLREEARALRVVAFDLAVQGCVGPRVPQPALAPVATSGLVRTTVLQVTLSIPAGARTLYVEAYRDTEGLDLFGTGCAEIVLAAGERRTVRLAVVAGGTGDADADADVPDDADADVVSDVDAVEDVPDGVDEGLEADFVEEDGGDEDLGESDGDASDAIDVDADDVPDGIDAPDTTDELPDVVEDEGSDSADAPGDADGTDTGPTTPTLVISEIDYDIVGADSTEFVELYNYGAAAVSCAGLELQFANGVSGTGVVEDTHVLTCLEIPAGGFHVVGSDALRATLPGGCSSERLLGGGDNLIQNGGTGTSSGVGDALALLHDDGTTLVVVDGVSYEGPVAGWGEGLPAPADSNTREGSLQRRPAGRDTNDNATDFLVLDPPTPCAPPP